MREKEVMNQALIDYQEGKFALYQEENTKEEKGGIVFTGDSIIDFFPLKKHLGRDLPLINRGIAGTDTNWLLKHIDEQVLILEPSKLFILIGTNDLGLGYAVTEIITRLTDLVSHIKRESLETSIYLISLLPVNEGETYADKVKIRRNQDIETLNTQLSVLPGAEFIPAHGHLLDAHGQLASNYTTDGLHLSPAGYDILARAVLPYL